MTTNPAHSELLIKLNNNEGKLPWDDGYMQYTKDEHRWIINLALSQLGQIGHGGTQ